MAIMAFEEMFLTLPGMQGLEHRTYRKGKGVARKVGYRAGGGLSIRGGQSEEGSSQR